MPFLPLDSLPYFKPLDLAYMRNDHRLRSFVQHDPDNPDWEALMSDRANRQAQRSRLTQALYAQYEEMGVDLNACQTGANIELLHSPHCFTITTAHQPLLLGGCLYFVYKIMNAIVLCQKLKERYPDRHFVPVYWMGGEDHDFAEINHFWLFGKRWEWTEAEADLGGAVADLRTDNLLPLLDELKAALGDSPQAQELCRLLNEAFYTQDGDYGRAHLRWVHALFRDWGLVVLDSRPALLKQAMIPVFEEELSKGVSRDNVLLTNAELEAQGFEAQAHARPINLFYFDRQGQRLRIVRDQASGGYALQDGASHFSREELLAELRTAPERFSPNVILRPLYQETVLPNLAYIGGGGELAYWLQLKRNFEHFDVPYPLLLRRSSALCIDARSTRQVQTWGFDWQTLLCSPVHELVKQWLQSQGAEFSLQDDLQAFDHLFERLTRRTAEQDPVLAPQVQAQRQATVQWLDKLEKRLIKTQKQRHETSVRQIENWHQRHFPGGGLQERHDSFLSLYLRRGAAFLQTLYSELDPLQKRFYIFTETES